MICEPFGLFLASLAFAGLEPAFPWYRSHDASLRIGKGDAEFVDMWHTNSGRLVDVRGAKNDKATTL